MKRKILFTLVIALLTTSLHAQKHARKNAQKTTAYAITAVQKGQSSWTEVRLVDVTTGEELKTIYQSSQHIEALNARTGKPVVKKETDTNGFPGKPVLVYNVQAHKNIEATTAQPVKKVVNLDLELNKIEVGNNVELAKKINSVKQRMAEKVMTIKSNVQLDKPFSTNSAACAYDKKHDRLYYTPMGINQLRYIDLKSKTSRVYYFEDEPFGIVRGRGDVPNHITRMVIGADGNGYALTNDGNHLIRFTTNRKPVITDLGALTDDPANGSFSIHSQQGYGGDMIADEAGDFYVFTANRRVFKVDLESIVATYRGNIQGLPKEYSTNGAIVEGGTTIIVSSATSTLGYYKFDLNTLQAEKASSGESVFNASDLANGILVSEDKRKEEELPSELQSEASKSRSNNASGEMFPQYKISIFPNPVTNGLVKLSFEDHPQGRYQIQLMDITGKIMSSQRVTINNNIQVEEFKLPSLITKGNYMLKIIGESKKVLSATMVAVQ